jgi:hypothetical protein
LVEDSDTSLLGVPCDGFSILFGLH